MNKFVKKIFLLFISGLLFSSSQQAFAQSFPNICGENGEILNDVYITSVAITGAKVGTIDEKRAFIFLNGNNNSPLAIKNFKNSDDSDTFLVDSIINNKLLNSKVDLCTNGRHKELYGINIR